MEQQAPFVARREEIVEKAVADTRKQEREELKKRRKRFLEEQIAADMVK